MRVSEHWRRWSIRTRLTLVYAALSLASGTVLMALMAFLFFRQPLLVTMKPVDPPQPPMPPGTRSAVVDAVELLPVNATVTPTGETLRVFFVEAAAGLAVMAVISTAIGWIVADRVLRPLRTMTSKTRLISARNLHERLALPGPRDELSELGDTIDQLLARLQAAFDAQRGFVANASHELRTPLAMMRTSVDVAEGKPAPVPREVTVLAGKLREGLDTADRLLAGLLLLARAQSDGLAGIERVSLAALAAAAIDARGTAIAAQGLSVELRGDDAYVSGNPMLLAGLVENLVDNAVCHNEPDGRLGITARTHGPRVRLVVENSGERLDPEAVGLLGRPFQRLGADRTSRPGTGLGLSIVAAIAAAHGGVWRASARPQGGLRVEVEL
ncbi:sensor histidine kinase [Yinghuangia soli]|uniref:histidine kinase n=1 Tax=Yinghuangia soli TaxID=2908204 RepID=A0AA41U4Y5_9ACTN|nr:HAMP domain-containing sensor histidine kinase [Yinghuangia soli]MCF2533430.1 HAMP domain-containing histidine kinase [Yinghuangia soli]